MEPVVSSKLYAMGRTFVITKIIYDDVCNIEKLIARCADPRPEESPWWRIDYSVLNLTRILEH